MSMSMPGSITTDESNTIHIDDEVGKCRRI
jgi:hypothetical protein